MKNRRNRDGGREIERRYGCETNEAIDVCNEATLSLDSAGIECSIALEECIVFGFLWKNIGIRERL